MTMPFVDAGDLMARRNGSVDPSKFPDEEFELHSIPAFDAGKPAILRGDQIGSTKQLVAPNDVMISKIVPHIRRSSIVPEFTGRRQIASGEWIVFRSAQFFPDYLRHALASNDFHAKFMATVSGVGGSLLRARPAEVAKIRISLPPLADQRRIASLLSHAEGIVHLRREAQRKAAELIPSLFFDLFGHPAKNPKGWRVAALGSLARFVSGGTPAKSRKDYWEGTLPWVSPKDMKSVVIEGAIDTINDRVLEETTLKLIPVNSVLIVVRGMILAHTVPVAITSVPITINQDMKALIASPEIDSTYLLWCLRVSQKWLLSKVDEAAHGTKKLDTARLEALPIPIPPIELQRKFAAKSEAARSIVAQQANAMTTAQSTFNALLSRSFQH